MLLKLVRSGSDLTFRQAAVLHGCELRPRTVRDLAEELNIAKPAITRATDKLVESGFVERRDDPTDRRSVLIALTTNGKKFLRTTN